MKAKNPQFSIIVFLDILGFKQLSKSHKDIEWLIDFLYEIREESSSFEEKIVEHEQKGNHTIQLKLNILSFSDHIILSVPLNICSSIPEYTDLLKFKTALTFMKFHISKLQIKALMNGISLRGAISVGDVYLDIENNIVTGESLIEAIENEQKLAIYPRVVTSKSLLQYSKNLNPTFPPHKFEFIKDFDGTYFIDYLVNQIWLSISTTDISSLTIIRNQIAQKLNKAHDNASIYQKWYWLAKYFDTSIGKLSQEHSLLENIQNILLPDE